jgi:hypothetical protein
LLANKSRDVVRSREPPPAPYQSNLTYLGGELDGSTITIYLSGQFMLGGVCDIPRAKAQLEYTAMAASAATSARVFVNGRPPGPPRLPLQLPGSGGRAAAQAPPPAPCNAAVQCAGWRFPGTRGHIKPKTSRFSGVM